MGEGCCKTDEEMVTEMQSNECKIMLSMGSSYLFVK